MKRSFKFWRKNEAEVMSRLGLKATKNSGSGWIEKEDGQNDYVICQLKSTDAQSIRIHQRDLHVLENNAIVEHKIPVFAIQFLCNDEVWIMAKPMDLPFVSEYIECGHVEIPEDDIGANIGISYVEPISVIKSSEKARDKFYKEKEGLYKKSRKAT